MLNNSNLAKPLFNISQLQKDVAAFRLACCPFATLTAELRLTEERREEGKKPKRAAIWKWVSVRELVFVFAACSVGAALFQTRDNVR